MAIGEDFHFLASFFSFDVNGQNLIAQPSTLKNVALRTFGKICVFGKN